MKLTEVLEALRTEREYQVRRWGHRHSDGSFIEIFHSLGNWLTFMEHYSRKAEGALTENAGNEFVLQTLRKVVALGLACLEHRSDNFVPDMDVVPTAESIGGFLCNIRFLLNQGREELFTASDQQFDRDVLNIIRQIIYQGVACFLIHGIEKRNPSFPVSNKHDGKPA